jgi:hypothetical protein
MKKLEKAGRALTAIAVGSLGLAVGLIAFGLATLATMAAWPFRGQKPSKQK